jgi:divalent metal cation (Fe/Co/Zn/Cd) transporter
LNSLTDIIASFAVLISIRLSKKRPDESHPFGHHRAEPIAALIVAIFAGVVGFEVMISSIKRLFVPEPINNYGITALRGNLIFSN